MVGATAGSSWSRRRGQRDRHRRSQRRARARPGAGYPACRKHADLAGADVVVLAVGVGQRPGETRLEFLGHNIKVVRRDHSGSSERRDPDVILLITFNPVNVITEIAVKISRLPGGRIFSPGTILDSSRFRALLGEHLDIASAGRAGTHGASHPFRRTRAAFGFRPDGGNLGNRMGYVIVSEDGGDARNCRDPAAHPRHREKRTALIASATI